MEQLPLFRPEVDDSQPSKPARGKEAPPIPAEIIVAAIELMGAIDLDPYCVNESTTLVPAKVHYAVDANALASSWGPKRRRVFLTPPTGRATANWMNKLCDEYEAGNVGQGIAYLRAALDSPWWQRLFAYPICIVHREIRLLAGSKSTTAPWAVVYLGANLRGFAESYREIGSLYVPYRGQTTASDVEAIKKAAAAERPAAREETIQQGDFTLTVHPTACYVTLSRPDWDVRDQNLIRRLVLGISGVLPSQYSSVSRNQDGTTRLVFSFKKGQARKVVGQIRKLLAGAEGKPSLKSQKFNGA